MYPCSKTGEQVGNVSSANRDSHLCSHTCAYSILFSLLNKVLCCCQLHAQAAPGQQRFQLPQ